MVPVRALAPPVFAAIEQQGQSGHLELVEWPYFSISLLANVSHCAHLLFRRQAKKTRRNMRKATAMAAIRTQYHQVLSPSPSPPPCDAVVLVSKVVEVVIATVVVAVVVVVFIVVVVVVLVVVVG